jgi:uncharacterized protein (DUF1800 family)
LTWAGSQWNDNIEGLPMSLQPWQPSAEQPWDVVRVAHLHRRAGFAPDWQTIQDSLQLGVSATIDCLVDFDNRLTPTYDKDSFEELSRTIGEAAVGAGSPDRLRAWWIFRMLKTPEPLVERLTLMWHNHFATSNEKVRDLGAMYEQNNVLRRNCLTNFGTLLPTVIKQAAMLIWLDATANRKEHPNENLARELMELFTLGEGNYSEADVREAARCLTGWTVRGSEFRYVAETHDAGEKTILGRRGKFGGDELLEVLLEHPATSQRLAWRLCIQFMGEELISTELIDQLASGLRDNELSIRWGVEKILRSRIFFSPVNIRSRIASPVELIIGALRSLELQHAPPSTLLLAECLRRLGQDLFYPPNVFGWPEGREWINTRSVLARNRFVQDLVLGRFYSPQSMPLDVEKLPQKYGFGTSLEEMVEFYALLISNQARRSDQYQDRIGVDSTLQENMRRVLVAILSSPFSQLS